MKNKFLAIALCGLLSIGSLAGCGNSNSPTTDSTTENSSSPVADSSVSPEAEKTSKFQMLDTDLKVGMVTDSGTIDDRSFNQGSWEGIKDTVKNNKYLKPAGVTDADYLESITNLYDAEFRFIVAPGYKFERAIGVSQNKYPDAKFVILDGSPVDENSKAVVGPNSVAIYFAEHESGFLAGVAAALQLKESEFGFIGGMPLPAVQKFNWGFQQGVAYANTNLGTNISIKEENVQLKESEFGFIGGMPLPAVQKFNWGFQQGVAYANTNLGTNISIKEENVVYQGTFDDKAGGQQIAAQMYDRGVKVIFTAAGGTGIGAITEAKSRATNGDTSVYVIGVDVDQYADGIYDKESNASVILTSAMKYIDQATYDMIKAEVEGAFPGGQTLTFSVANDGVGIPSENPNLSEETLKVVEDTYAKIKSGEVTVADSNDGSLIK